jgi:small subunit ribosomal protein S13
MARIKGIDLPKNKRGVIGLTYVYGIGSSFAVAILDEAKVSHDKKVQDWSDDEANAIRAIVGDKYTVEGELRAEKKMKIKIFMYFGCYRGILNRLVLHL